MRRGRPAAIREGGKKREAHMPYALSAGAKLYYEEAGSGYPLLFVHEFAGDHRSCGRARRHWNTPPDGRWQRLQLSHRQRGCEKKSGAEREHVL